MKRKCIYILNNSDGIIDQYIHHSLNCFKDAFDSLILVSRTAPDSLEYILRSNDRTMNCPVTVGGEVDYESILNQIGWSELACWDEVVLTDDSLMGPVSPLHDIFSRMEKKTEIFFWGLTACRYTGAGENKDESQFYIPFRFISFRKELLKKAFFREVWNQDTDSEIKGDAGERKAYNLTRTLMNAGYRWDTYVRTPEDRLDISDFLLFDPIGAIRDEHCPMFLKESFTCSQMKYITVSAGEQPWELLQYLQRETDYDVSMILKALIRREHQDDLARTLRMTYVLPSKETTGRRKCTQRVALVMHLFYMDLLEESLHYASSMPEEADLYIFTCSQDKAEKISGCFQSLRNSKEIRVTENRGRDVGSFLVETAALQKKYDLICFYHDKKSGHIYPHLSGSSFAYKTAECVLSSGEYVQNVIDLFEKNPYLGMISGPTPNHATLLNRLGKEWDTNYFLAKDLAAELKIRVPMDQDHVPAIGLGDVFWYRTKAMMPMFRKEWTYEDFPEEPIGVDGTILHAIERVYPFAVQEAGYLPGRVMPDHIAALEILNLEFYVREYNRVRMDEDLFGDIRTVTDEMRKRLSKELLELAKSASFPAQLRLSLKRHLPGWLFRMIYGIRNSNERIDLSEK